VTPEGQIKADCRKIAKRHGLMFRNVQGKGFNGWPDTECGKYPKGSGTIKIEFKRPTKEPTEQQWLRITEIQEAGGEAGWCDSVAGYKRLVGLP
jgi:hypothetical protein